MPEESKARPIGELRPEAKVVLVPSGVNLRILPLLKSASKRLPEPSKARLRGPPNPEAKGVLVPAGVNLKIVLLL